MEESNIQEAFDYMRGQITGLQAVCAALISHLATSDSDRSRLRDALNGVADYTVAIDVSGDLAGVPRETRAPFYEGIRQSIVSVTETFAQNPSN